MSIKQLAHHAPHGRSHLALSFFRPALIPILTIFLAIMLAAFFSCWQAPALDSNPGPEIFQKFPAGVWLQKPEAVLAATGKTYAQTYADMGITTYLGLWHWPDAVDMYPSYPTAAMKALKDAGLVAYAGSAQDAVDWIAAHPEYADTLVGYLLGDEPDMKKTSSIPATAAASMPGAWNAAGMALRAADPTRGLYANFGKGFGKPNWAGYQVNPGPTKADDFAAYVEPLTLVSSDFYGITDPWEPASYHGVWTYGRAVAHTILYAGPRPVWGFVEVSAPWTASDYARVGASHLMVHMDPDLIFPITWTMAISGARGIAYFCHDFSGSGLGDAACFKEPGMPEAMQAANASLSSYGKVLLEGQVLPPPQMSQSGDGPPPLVIARAFGGKTWIFAIGSGDEGHIHGLDSQVTVTVQGATTNKVIVMGEDRSIWLRDSAFSDTFGPYELHIYRY